MVFAKERDIAVALHWFRKPDPVPKRRDRVLSDVELKYFWRACDKIGHPFGPLFKTLLLTGARLNEGAGMTWEELDQNARIWSLRIEAHEDRRSPRHLY